MRNFVALCLAVVVMIGKQAWGFPSFAQCMETLDIKIQDCVTNYSSNANFNLFQIERLGGPLIDGDGSVIQYFKAGCIFQDISGGTVDLVGYCQARMPSKPIAPKKGSFGPGSCESGSIVRVDEMTVGEEIPLTGTSFNLIYTSERTLGRSKSYKTTFYLPAAKKSPKDSYQPQSGSFQYTYANGRQGSTILTAGQTVDFYWDGKDSSGSYLEAPTQMTTTVYLTGFNYSVSSDMTTADSIGTWNVQAMGLGGWNLDIHHLFDPITQKLYLGEGSIIPVLSTFDGTKYRVVSANGSEVYYFNTQGKHLTTNNALTNAVKYTFSYLLNGYLSGVVDAYGRTTSILRDGSGNLTGIQGPYGQITQLTIGTSGYLASIKNPKNETYQMTYYSNGLLNTFQKPKGQISTMVYDGNGHLLSNTSSAGNYIGLSLNDTTVPALVTVQDILGVKKTSSLWATKLSTTRSDSFRSGSVEITDYSPSSNYTYSQQGILSDNTNLTPDPRFSGYSNIPSTRSISLISPSLASNTSFLQTVYNSSGSPTPFNYDSITYQTTTNGKTSNASYTRATGVTNVSSPVGRINSFTTDTLGKVTNAKYANFQPTQMSYDTHGRLRYITQGTRQSEIQYNASGDISGVKNPLNQTTTFGYDLAGRVQSVVLPDLRAISYTYDTNGNIATITPSGTSAHTFTFNPFDLPSYYTPPTVPTSTPATHYTYDNAKRVTQITKPDSSNVTFTYHPTTGLLTSIVASGDATTMTINPYSNQPSAIRSQDGIATTQVYASDLFVSSATTDATSQNIGQVAYTYNNDFRPTNLTVTAASSSTFSVPYTYDNDGIMNSVGAMGISLDATTGLKTKAVLNKIQEVYSFDSSYGEPSSLFASYVPTSGTSTPLFVQSYTRDALGRVQTKSETVGTTTNQFVYTYDTSGRLTDVTKNAVAYSHYNFSNNNNLTSGNVGGVAFTATYDAQDRILTYNSNTFTHTLNGEMKTKKVGSTTTTYTWNGFGMLKTAQVGTGAVQTYLYDGLNRLVGKKSGTTIQKYWVYQDQLRIAAELNASGVITKKFIYGTKVNVPDYMISGTTTYKIISDHLGSVRLVVNAATGAIAQKIEYNELGAVISDTSAGFQPFYFAGGVYDTTTKLLAFGARVYDPSIGRWLSKDPIGFGGGDTNLYSYVGGDPMNYIDPTGLDREIVRTRGLIPHDYLRVFDPSMPGNDTYIDFGPAGGKTNVLFNLLRDVLGEVNISDERPSGAYYLPGSFQKTSRQADEALLNRANSAALRALRGDLMYSVKEFNYNQNSKQTNCRGFAGGL